jgi:hypothetical protein
VLDRGPTLDVVARLSRPERRHIHFAVHQPKDTFPVVDLGQDRLACGSFLVHHPLAQRRPSGPLQRHGNEFAHALGGGVGQRDAQPWPPQVGEGVNAGGIARWDQDGQIVAGIRDGFADPALRA